MRADRLLSLMLLLEVHRKMTAQEMAERLEVSERTIQRDMETLSAAGIPVYAERGSGGGWSIQEGYHFRLNALNDAETRSLFLGSPARLLSDLGLEQSSDAAFMKLSAALAPGLRQQAEYAKQRLLIDEAGWSRREEASPFLQLLLTAVWEERMLQFTYQKLSDAESAHPLPQRLVNPLGLIAKGTAWYLAASTEDGIIRTYRVSRIRSANLLEQKANRPEGFDLARYWEQSKSDLKQQLPRYPAEVLIDPSIERVIRQALYVQVNHIGSLDPEQGWIPLSVDFHNLHSATEFVLSQGPRIKVLKPYELREQVLSSIRRIEALYSSASESSSRTNDPQE